MRYAAKSQEEAVRCCNVWLAEMLSRLVAHKARIDARREATSEGKRNHGIVAGNLLHRSWGYDQTNADVWQVVSVKGMTATCVALSGSTNETGPMSGTFTVVPLTPSELAFIDPTKLVKMRITGKGAVSVPGSRGYAYATSHTSFHVSWYA